MNHTSIENLCFTCLMDGGGEHKRITVDDARDTLKNWQDEGNDVSGITPEAFCECWNEVFELLNGNKEASTMKVWNIDTIQALDERGAQEIALETMQIKGHSVYFTDFGGNFKYSALVFADGRHMYYANEYELHYTHMGYSRQTLRERFIDKLNGKLFTEAEITGTITDYGEFRRKADYLHNLYGMRREHISIFGICPSDAEREAYKVRTAAMTYDPICFAYFDDAAFVEHHIALHKALTDTWQARQSDYEVIKSAFVHEMYNHEYAINWQGDWDVLSCWGSLVYCRDDGMEEIEDYFDQLHFTDTQRRAYLDARREYFRQVNESDD